MMKNDFIAVNTLVETINVNLKSIYVTHAEKDDVYEFKTKGNAYYCYLLVVKGKMTLMMNGFHSVDIEEGNAVFLWESDVLSYCFGEDTQYYWVYFSLIGNNLTLSKPFPVETEKTVVSIKKCLAFLNRSALIELCRANMIFSELILDGVEKLYEQELNKKSFHRKSIEQSVDFIKDNLNDLLSIQDLANNVGMSLKQYRKHFKKIMGVFPAKYIADQRLLLAKDYLLNTGLTIGQISDMLNFSSPYYLSYSFKKMFNCSPKEYRNKYRE